MKPVRISQEESMFFRTFIDEAGNWLDTAHFPRSAQTPTLYMDGGLPGNRFGNDESGAYSVNIGHMVKVAVKAKGDADCEKKITPVTVNTENFTMNELTDSYANGLHQA